MESERLYVVDVCPGAMRKKEKDEHFAAHVPGILHYHELMLTDAVRNALLHKAIKRHVTRNTNFLDVGAGTGVWAILAAKLGAKRVVAIEIEECLIPIIHKLAQENGVADRIEIVHGDSNDVRLRGKFDVIVCELFGTEALGKRTIGSFIDLRDRFLAKGGVLIPQSLLNFAVPVHLKDAVDTIPARLPVSFEYLRSLKVNYPRNVPLADREKLIFLADPVMLLQMDFATITEAPKLSLSAEWKLRNISRANGFAMFTSSVFAPGIEMNGFDSKSWGATVFEFRPFQAKRGRLRIDLDMHTGKSIWKVSVPEEPGFRPAVYSQAFTPARLRMAQQVTPFKKVRASGIEK